MDCKDNKTKVAGKVDVTSPESPGFKPWETTSSVVKDDRYRTERSFKDVPKVGYDSVSVHIDPRLTIERIV